MAFWGLSSWAEAEEEAAHHQRCRPVWVPAAQLSWGWAEGDHGRGLWDAAGRGAAWSDVGEDQCGRPAAAGGGEDGGDDDDVVDVVDRQRIDVVAVAHWSMPNEALPRPSVASVFSFWL